MRHEFRVTRFQVFVVYGVVAAGAVIELFAVFHRWQDRVFMVGFGACLGAVGLLISRMRRRRDRLTLVVFAVTVPILAAMTAINSYSIRFHFVTGVILFLTAAAAVAVVAVREHRVRSVANPDDYGGASGEAKTPS
jgi:hypothetical protein